MNQNFSSKLLIGYFPSWAKYRSSPSNPDDSGGKYDLEDIPGEYLTHVIYSFVGIDPKTQDIQLLDEWGDQKTIPRIATHLKPKYPHLQVLVAIGGWNFSQQYHHVFRRIASDSLTRQRFVQNCIHFCTRFSFDGIDMDWEFPQSREDRHSLTELMREFRFQFNQWNSRNPKHRLLLTIATPGGSDAMEKGFDLPRLSRYVDWFHVMTYDFEGSWNDRTGHHSSLHDTWTTIHDLYMKQGRVRSDQIVMGMPLYGRTWSLQSNYYNNNNNNNNNYNYNFINSSFKNYFNNKRNHFKIPGPGSNAVGPGKPGTHTQEPGVLPWNEIHQEMISSSSNSNSSFHYSFEKRNKGNRIFLPSTHSTLNASYGLLNEDQWISFDHVRIVREKLNEIVKRLNLRGVMLWSIDADVPCSNRIHRYQYGSDEISRIPFIASILHIPVRKSFSNDQNEFSNRNSINNNDHDHDTESKMKISDNSNESKWNENKGELVLEQTNIVSSWETGLDCHLEYRAVQGNITDGWRTSILIFCRSQNGLYDMRQVTVKNNHHKRENESSLLKLNSSRVFKITSIWNVGYYKMKEYMKKENNDLGDIYVEINIHNAEWNQMVNENENLIVGFVFSKN